MRVSAAGGTASQLTIHDPERQERTHNHPTFLPDGRHFLYLRYSTIPEDSGVYVGSLDVKPEEQSTRQILSTNFGPVYIPYQNSGPGQLLFLREQTLMVQRFDDKRLELIGEPIPVAEQVGSIYATGLFSASKNGVLVYHGMQWGGSQLIWFDRSGKQVGPAGESGMYESDFDLSPDGKQIAIVQVDPTTINNDIWLIEWKRNVSTRLTFDPAPDSKVV